ncbi:alpha/beta fold hydrolase [Nonomuraea sp. NPDC049400]|uniref:alpha/beta fold hydrolase n=1 Tax=Nonomuraea sp. NPDC049400 TaxID=3364352 RepID=UPI0037A70854
MSKRMTVEVDGRMASYLTAGERGPVVLLLHGTYWSRVWEPVIDDLAAAGLRPVAVDLPGLGRSEGELTAETAAVPALAAWAGRFAAAVGARAPLLVAGHDIGGAVAQHLLVESEVARLALVNSVTYDSWPVSSVARYRDPAMVAATTVEELLAARRKAVTIALGRPASEAELADYLDPWRDLRVGRSWMALAGAADSRYTLDLVPALKADETPKLLVWGADDPFQEVRYAERFVAEIPNCTLVRIPGAGHIPMENDPAGVARALADFFLS